MRTFSLFIIHIHTKTDDREYFSQMCPLISCCEQKTRKGQRVVYKAGEAKHINSLQTLDLRECL